MKKKRNNKKNVMSKCNDVKNIISNDTNKMNDLNVESIKTQEDINRCRTEIIELKKERKYNAAMEKIISLFNAGHTDADLMLDLAQIYYNTQDYMRAESWARNSYNKDGSIDTLIFLAKIYSSDDKMENMAEILNKILKNNYNVFSDEQKKVIDDLIFYVELIYELDEINKKFPNIAKWMNRNDAIDGDFEEPEVIDNKEDGSFNDSINNEQQDECRTDKDIEENITESFSNDESEKKVNDILLKLANGESISDEEIDYLIQYNASGLLEAIDSLSVSLNKKILTDNFIAAAYYEKGKSDEAIFLLKAALNIDDQNDLILKNIGFIFFEQGDKKRAKIAFQAVQNKDFMLCDLLKKCCDDRI
ncbi:tetratricopeptide repeat protein [Pectinatus frisingensis]|uniref:tetratricopeptide repeat protein n=1 Tax=Pectinatus frisingensis TaxID=865 RepID=UPI0018C48A85|nr:tetratricopeptide repeat protein [Pectinatus frisingensis]